MTPAEAKTDGRRDQPDIARTCRSPRYASPSTTTGWEWRSVPGSVPLVVLFGHSHAPRVAYRGGTAYVNAGTTGGAGVRGLETEEPVRISLAVVYLRMEERARVVAVDIIRLSPGGRRLHPRKALWLLRLEDWANICSIEQGNPRQESKY